MSVTKQVVKSAIWLGFLCPCLNHISFNEVSAQPKIQTENQIQINGNLSVVMNRNSTYTVSNGSSSKELPQRKEILLRYQSFDPVSESPRALSSSIRRETVNAIGKQAYIVQFTTQAFESYQSKLRELGCKIYNHIPYQALLVHMDVDTKSKVEKLPYVRWVGEYYADYKLDSDIFEDYTNRATVTAEKAASQRYSVMLCENNGQQKVARKVRQMGGKVNLLTAGKRMEVAVGQEQIIEIAAMKEVLFIDKYCKPELDMDIVRELGGANYLENVEGYTGQGVRFEVVDGGIYEEHENVSNKNILWRTSKQK
ncbi:MAG: hypothetical protein MI922_26500, partial [Bacteroidales bacterium]|nr:hypothetical protein [Bacteroidales bacterium]